MAEYDERSTRRGIRGREEGQIARIERERSGHLRRPIRRERPNIPPEVQASRDDRILARFRDDDDDDLEKETLDVESLSQVEKLIQAVSRSAKHLPGEVAEELKALFTPATLATMVAVFAVYIAAHATGIGQAMDIGMLIAGGIFFGLDAFTIFKDVAGFAGAVNATTEEELDQAGEHLASAVAKIGVDAVMTLLTKKVADEIGKSADHVNQVDEVHAHSDNANAGRVDDVDNTSPNRTEIDEPQPNQPVQSNDSPDVANQSTKPTDEVSGNIKNKISSSPDKFELIYSDTEINNLIHEGRKLGLDDATIEDLIFIGSRRAKPMTTSELLSQMDNYVNTVGKRGFPYRFDNLEQYTQFKTDLIGGLDNIQLPIDDVRIQGSSLRTPNAKDLDIAIFIDDADFDKLLIESFANKIKLNGEAVNLSDRTHSELVNLAKDIMNNPDGYNSKAKTFAFAIEKGKIRPQDVSGLRRFKKSLEQTYGEIDISVLSENGEFDVKPFWRIE